MTSSGVSVGSAGESVLHAYGSDLRMSFATYTRGQVLDSYGFDVAGGSGLSFVLRTDTQGIEQIRLDGG
jgi:hypothetical protein